MAPFLRVGQILLGSAVLGLATPACYSAGAGTSPPPESFYFPVGLAVAPDSRWLYAVNSDFDLQWNGGTLQSYDLAKLRADAIALVEWNLDSSGTKPRPSLSLLGPAPAVGCISTPPVGVPLGQSCAPPVDSRAYFRDSAVIGAFAIDLQISNSTLDGKTDGLRRLFVPVRGDATLTWADLPSDGTIDCGVRVDGRCNPSHHAGSNPNEAHNSRNLTLPGEPFGMAQTEDGTALAITHQTDTKASLLTTGLPGSEDPAMQFVLDGLPTGGNGIAAVPHDPDAVNVNCASTAGDATPCVRPSFLVTSHDTAEIDLLRYYSDDGSTLSRPFLQREAAYALTANAGGTDSRGIVIDPTPRLLCKRRVGGAAATSAALRECARLPARVFFASRTPPALVVGAIGQTLPSDSGSSGLSSDPSSGPYDPDRLVVTKNIPLPNGPSRVYLAPIVDARGQYLLRVFIVCFDSSQVVVYDPEAEAVENIINVGQGPFAMAFDHFELTDILPPEQAPDPSAAPLSYRFAYVASFTQSFVQMIDLNQHASPATFESVVFTLGQPTNPKGQ